MKALIVYAHPKKGSFSEAVCLAVKEELGKRGVSCEVEDLYAQGFDPRLSEEDQSGALKGVFPEDVRRAQSRVSQADLLVLVHPLWWSSVPAILKGWIDRVLAYGFAYDFGDEGLQGLLKGKKVALFTSTGASEELLRQGGTLDALRVTLDEGVFGSCGVEVVLHRYLFGPCCASDEERRAMLETVRRDAEALA